MKTSLVADDTTAQCTYQSFAKKHISLTVLSSSYSASSNVKCINFTLLTHHSISLDCKTVKCQQHKLLG